MQGFYWRFCYSYLTCSTIAGFESAYASGTPLSMVLTGAPGTGKSVFGAFVALLLSKVFDWRVTYKWGQKSVSFGGSVTSGKKITVWDPGSGEADVDLGSECALIVGGGARSWRRLAEQEAWSGDKGNFLFVDPVPRHELAEMAGRLKKTKEFEKNYPVVGGAPRACFEPPRAVAAKVGLALGACRGDLPGALRRLRENAPGGAGARPDLLAHFQPSSPYRNEAFVEVSSRYVEKQLAAQVAQRSETDIEQLLHELSGMPQAHSFASLVWEPLFAKRIAKPTGRLIISATRPGPKSEETQVLLDTPLEKLHHFQLRNLEDFETQCKEWLALLQSAGAAAEPLPLPAALLGKPTDYKCGALDAVLVKVENGACVLAGLQISVARIGSKPMDCGAVVFAKMGDALKKLLPEGYSLRKEIWFLQPDGGAGFDFEYLQACGPKAAKRSKKRAAPQQAVKVEEGVKAEGAVEMEGAVEAEDMAETEAEPPRMPTKKRRRKLDVLSSKSFVVGASKQVRSFFSFSPARTTDKVYHRKKWHHV